MFLGREKELAAIRNCINDGGNIMVYGPRRVGKTTLLKEALKESHRKIIWYECIECSYEYNIELLAKSAALALSKSYLQYIRDIFELFDAIDECATKCVVVVDEYPYLKTSNVASHVDSYFQKLIDLKYENISFVLCGSYISMMKELLTSDNPLFGRFSLKINLKQFNYLDAALFYPDLATREKIEFYSVFGGYPFILERLDANKSLEENIEELLLGDMGSIREEIENSILKEIAKAGLSREIIARIGNSRLRFKEIEDSFSVDVRGTLDREIKRLIEMQLIEKSYPINRKDDRKKSFYELSDNLLRFYYSYIFPVKSRLAMLSAKAFYKNFIEESLNTFISKRVEGIAREYFIRKNKEAPESSIIDIGTYWYDDKTKHINGEFDCVLKTLSDEYEVYEVKYLKEPMTKSSIEKEVEKIKSIKDFRAKTIGMISSSGFKENYPGVVLISGDELYKR